MYDSLITTFEYFGTLNPEDKKLIERVFKPMSLKKGDYFIETGCKSDKVGFLVKGLVYYSVLKNNEEAITDFTKEGEFVSEYHTFTAQQNAIHSIKAIEDSLLLVTNYEGLQSFFNDTQNGNKIGRLIIEHRFGVVVNQLLSLNKNTPEERYHLFVKDYFELTQRIPQYLIAAFIGVKPQSLSRIRSRLSKPLY